VWCANAHAEPSFARKYNADCTLCHTVYPRLNRTGYLFRRLGYRLPADVQRRFAPTSATPLLNTPPPNATTPPDSQAVHAGRDLFETFHCGACHTAEGKGGSAGPVLDGVASRRSAEYIKTQIKDPKSHNPSSTMPAVHASDEQIATITAYLSSLQGAAEEQGPRQTRISDYFAASWAPTISVSQASGNTNASYDTREMELFIAGTLGDHVSLFVAALPTNGTPGFANYWDVAQGLLNFGNAQNSSETRFGQLLTLQGAGFGGTDRSISEGPPLIYFPVNGFAAGRFGRGVSEEYMIADSTTLKVFGVEEAGHSRAFGAVWEQLIGNKGLQGISLEYAGGWNPSLLDGPGPELHFQRAYVSANKTFQDSRGVERINIIGGLAFGNDSQLVGGDANRRSETYGWYGEVDAFPIVRHLGTYFRYDALRPSNLTSGMMRAVTAGAAIDIVKYARIQLEYEHFDFFQASNIYTIGFRLNF